MGLLHKLKCKLPILARVNWPHFILRIDAMRNYKRYHGYSFDIKKPITFTEKILWYMLEYDKCDEISYLTDKIFHHTYHIQAYTKVSSL